MTMLLCPGPTKGLRRSEEVFRIGCGAFSYLPLSVLQRATPWLGLGLG